jgi:threonyl-tRNA synthetase
MLVPVDPKFSDYAKSVHDRLFAEGYHVDVDFSGNTLNKKIRNAQLAQYNFILVVGAKEVEANSVNIRTRDNQVHGEKSVDEVLADFQRLVAEWK